ncbi:YheV family putative zinc ribbon protein [Litoribrevibacter euphylliae]|uniref:YheV family putative zinc ribbon protein n=1 Tax=Litoribrevibacter euphylliae TaxID=1834034 RepID=A0ABV7HFJ8_9GAMM
MKKRFIAGAVCPRCSEMDKIVMYTDDNGVQTKECVACGFSENMKDLEQQQELATRVTPEQEAVRDEEVQVLQFHSNSESKH